MRNFKINLVSIRRNKWRVVHRAMIIPVILLICVLILTCLLLVWSPGKVKTFLDDNGRPLAGSISEKIFLNINGVQQGMFIKSKNKTNPILLFLHGGPSMPEYTLARQYPTGLEDYFIVCYWDQRGAGLSFNPDTSPETVTVEQMIADTLQVTNYLRQRFGQEKIYLMGHSGGSFYGIQAAARAPELYKAYIGVSQIARQLESEKLAYRYMIEQYAKVGDKRMMQKLEKFPITELEYVPDEYRSLRDEAMHRLGIGTMHNMKSVLSGIFLPTWQNREYTLNEKIGLWRGKWSVYSRNLWNQIIATDLTAKIQKLEIPVYFFHGIYDYTITYSLTKDYFEMLQAPVKGFYTFEHSAHSPMYEEPEKMQQIIQEDVLLGVNNLADTQYIMKS